MVVDGHLVFAEALALAIDGSSTMRCVAIASGGDEALQVAHDSTPDVVVIDVLEGNEGIDTTKTDVAFDQIKRRWTLHLSGTPFKACSRP